MSMIWSAGDYSGALAAAINREMNTRYVWDDFEQLKSGLDIMDIVLKKLENEEPSHHLHTTFTRGNVKVESK